MANTPKYARKTAKAYAQAQRSVPKSSKLSDKVNKSTEVWPKRFPNARDVKLTEYVGKYALKNSPKPVPRQFTGTFVKKFEPEYGYPVTRIAGQKTD